MPKNNHVSILLVEDDEVDVMSVQRAFKRAQMENPIIVASDGVEALAKLRNGNNVPRPYLILLDLNMPRMGGVEFLKEIRKDPVLQSSVVFVLTTSNARTDRIFAYQYNVAGYIVKIVGGERVPSIADFLKLYLSLVELPSH